MSSTTVAEGKLKKTDHIMAGLGVALTSSLFEGVDGETRPALFLDVRYGDFFARRKTAFDQDLTIGFDWLENDSVTLSVAASIGNNRLEVENQELHLGIKDRDSATEIGFVGRYRSRVGLLEGFYFQDISNNHDSAHAQMKLSNPLPGHGKLSITPGFFFTYSSAKYNSFYYGVSKAENILGNSLNLNPDGSLRTTLEQFEAIRPVYDPGNNIHAGVDLYLEYKLSEKLNASGYLFIEDITGEIETSPLVDDKTIIVILLGVNYRF